MRLYRYWLRHTQTRNTPTDRITGMISPGIAMRQIIINRSTRPKTSPDIAVFCTRPNYDVIVFGSEVLLYSKMSGYWSSDNQTSLLNALRFFVIVFLYTAKRCIGFRRRRFCEYYVNITVALDDYLQFLKP